MKQIIGIRYEDKYLMEKRVALVPEHVKQLTDAGFKVEVVPSEKRIFKDEEYVKSGAVLKPEPLNASLILGVKEMPIDYFKEGNTYIFFSHTIKGQPYNMPLLQNMIDHKINLIDYERIVDEQGRRLIFFGRFAGLAGMINSLWSLGVRMEKKGIETPFKKLKQTHNYNSLEEAKAVVKEIGDEIRLKGLPSELTPLTIGITGYGHVSKGAQEILELLPVREISPEELAGIKKQKSKPGNFIYKVVFKEKDLVKRIENPDSFSLEEYYHHPDMYKGIFEQYIPHLKILMNCMYWDERYPRIITKKFLKKAWDNGISIPEVIGDITCDPEGSVEITFKGTPIEDPVFVYNPETGKHTMGFDGEGVLVMAVDILPSELPRESSMAFSSALMPFLPQLATADFSVSFDNLEIPGPLKRGMILYHGAFTPDYTYMSEFITNKK